MYVLSNKRQIEPIYKIINTINGLTSMEEDIYISILKFAKEKAVDGFDLSELYAHLCDIGHLTQDEFEEMTTKPSNHIKYETAVKLDHLQRLAKDSFIIAQTKKSRRYSISTESYFNLLEHQELVEARKGAKTATFLSLSAIMISLISVGWAIYISNKPMHIDEEQIKSIIGEIHKGQDKIIYQQEPQSISNHTERN
jgi:hypothetical protein